MTALLALDTATEQMSVALVVGERTWTHESRGGAEASSRLIPAIRALLDEAGLAPPALAAIAFGQGPGAFTGLRTACAVAQGYAFALGVPVLALDTLMVVAETARQREPALRDVWVAMDARMGEVYAARYRLDEGPGDEGPAAWRVLDAPALVAPEALRSRWADEAPAAVAGSALAAFGARRDAGPQAHRVEVAAPSAGALAVLARDAWARGAARLDAAAAVPLYLRDKVAFTTAERAAASSAAGRRAA